MFDGFGSGPWFLGLFVAAVPIGAATNKGHNVMTTHMTARPNLHSGPAQPSTSTASIVSGVVGVLFAGAIFGFFYAWVCSTMWGLDDADPRVAIQAMQAMNASVRNAVFFPTFFLTPLVLAVAAGFARRDRAFVAAKFFGAAALVYFLGGMVLTGVVNVPMNTDLAEVVVPDSIEAAGAIWNDYSSTWQIWNIARTVFSGISLLLAAFGLTALRFQRSKDDRDPV